MYRIVYTGRAGRPLSDSAIQDICHRATASNQAAKVTGLLLLDGQQFIHALEGDRAMVEVAMDRILLDLQHNSAIYISLAPIIFRQFDRWFLDYDHINEGGFSNSFLTRVKMSMDSVHDLTLKAAFIGFASLSAGHH